MKKILKSLLVVGVVAIVVFGATKAFFSDTEESKDNTFTAGAIDLKVDNTSYYNGSGTMQRVDALSWALTDLTDQLFFNFADVKPGDLGEDTVSLHVTNNPAWVCADIDITANDDVTCTEPELTDDSTCDATLTKNGELASELNFIFWKDDGDNVLEDDETVLTQGPANTVLNGVTWAIADSTTGDPMTPDTTYNIGKAWCFGVLTEDRVPQGQGVNPTVATGVKCDGKDVNNAAQTDKLMGNITFRATQARHQEGYVCTRPQSGPVVETRNISLENKDGSNWNVIPDDQIYGLIQYSHNDTSFHGVVTGTGLVAGGKYQITLNGSGGCTFTDSGFAGMGPNAFSSGYWNNGTNLEPTCGTPGEGVYNMNLIGDHYTFIADGSGAFNYPFSLNLPAGNYSGVKVLVKKMLDTHVSPWADTGTGYPMFNLYETAAISFTVL